MKSIKLISAILLIGFLFSCEKEVVNPEVTKKVDSINNANKAEFTFIYNKYTTYINIKGSFPWQKMSDTASYGKNWFSIYNSMRNYRKISDSDTMRYFTKWYNYVSKTVTKDSTTFIYYSYNHTLSTKDSILTSIVYKKDSVYTLAIWKSRDSLTTRRLYTIYKK